MMLQKKTLKNKIQIGHKFLLRILVIRGLGSGKTISFSLTRHQADIHKIY